MLTAYFLLKMVNFRREEFYRAAALGAHHVMMAAPVVLMFVSGYTVMKGNFTCQPAFGKQLKRAVHGGKADLWVFLLYQAVQFVRRKMLPRLQERAQNRIALFGVLQTYAFQMSVKNLLRLAHHFPGDAGLVINSLLQIGRQRGLSGFPRLWDSIILFFP